MTTAKWKRNLDVYDQAVARVPGIERKGKTMPYTSANGHMFSQLNKDGDLGVRLSDEDRKRFAAKHTATPFKSYGAVMHGYVKLPAALLKDVSAVASYLKAGYKYAKSLPPK